VQSNSQRRLHCQRLWSGRKLAIGVASVFKQIFHAAHWDAVPVLVASDGEVQQVVHNGN